MTVWSWVLLCGIHILYVTNVNLQIDTFCVRLQGVRDAGDDDSRGSGGYYPWSGPGSKKLVQGTLTLGYFGIVTQAEFIDRDTLRSLGPASLSAYNIGTMTWHKFAYNGRIIYIPRSPIAQNARWLDLYNAGMIYGVRGSGTPPLPTGVTGVDQLATTVVYTNENGVDCYWPINIRAMYGNEADPAVSNTAVSKSEYDILFKGLRDGIWERYSSDTAVTVLVADRMDVNKDYYWPRMPTGYVAMTLVTDSGMRWQPALELITDPNIVLDVYRPQLIPNVGGASVRLNSITNDYDTVSDVKAVVLSMPGVVPEVSIESLRPGVSWTVSVDVGMPLTIVNADTVRAITPALIDNHVDNLENYQVRNGEPSVVWALPVDALHTVVSTANDDTVSLPKVPVFNLSARSDIILILTQGS